MSLEICKYCVALRLWKEKNKEKENKAVILVKFTCLVDLGVDVLICKGRGIRNPTVWPSG